MGCVGANASRFSYLRKLQDNGTMQMFLCLLRCPHATQRRAMTSRLDLSSVLFLRESPFIDASTHLERTWTYREFRMCCRLGGGIGRADDGVPLGHGQGDLLKIPILRSNCLHTT